ncbi:D-alanyl-D-alanine carboxypeptidase family protein [Sphingobium boeckii]|uniref:serine-type D-Ala-D-Ala carboxypeptidase n=1 Tax=Sphingobium boeckii TaxID=1082345 RepID=A0A7W9AKT7_9SPHN|nr:D-alanyl-D-alanine carboxypeptidase family protein [Sphingobium boeckii]MBB5687311.1 D-alanyl-D-alanine carboxypeptidase (penicillin-binding protein 5/6) [Sphingobium boeckii]
MKPVLIPSLLAIALSLPASAAAPPYTSAAPIAYMEDLSSGAVLYDKGADTKMPPASMAKMMTVMVVFDLIQSGKLKLDQKFQVRPETWRKWHGPEAGSTMFLETGEMVSVDDLLQGVVTLSGNDACVVLAEGIAGTEEAFVARMNARAKELGLKNSNFGTSNGWPDEGRSYVTARDLVKLAKATIETHPKLYKQYYARPNFVRTLSDGKVIDQANRDPLLGRIPGADGLKTGHTEEAGYGFTGSAVQNNRRIVMVVAGLDSFNGRIEESVKFIDWGFKAWSSMPIVAAGKRVQTAEVQLGSDGEVGLIAPRDIAVTLPTGASANMKVSVVYNGPIKAPIKKGDHIADIVVTTPDTPPQTMPLVAENDVAEAGFFGRAWAGLLSIFGA